MIDKWKKCVDSNMVFGAVLTDLSKAFDCICHNLLKAKLNASGLSLSTLKLIRDYLQNRRLKTQIESSYSDWEDITSRVHYDPFCSISFYVTYLLKIKTITLQIMLMIPSHTLLEAQQQKFQKIYLVLPKKSVLGFQTIK